MSGDLRSSVSRPAILPHQQTSLTEVVHRVFFRGNARSGSERKAIPTDETPLGGTARVSCSECRSENACPQLNGTDSEHGGDRSRAEANSRRAPKPNDRHVHLSVNALELNVERGARLSGNEDLRPRARRSTQPVRTRLNPRSTVGRSAPEVDLIRRAASQAGMRPMLVIPVDPARHVTLHGAPAGGNRNKADPFFHCP